MKKILIGLAIITSPFSFASTEEEALRDKRTSNYLENSRLKLPNGIHLTQGGGRFTLGQHCTLNLKNKYEEDVIINPGTEVKVGKVTESGSNWGTAYDEVKRFHFIDTSTLDYIECIKGTYKRRNMLTISEVANDISDYFDIIEIQGPIHIKP